MSVQCFTRDEHNGIHVIFPLEGPKKQNCLLVNDTVRLVYDRVQERMSLPQLRALFLDRASTLYRNELAQWNGEDEERRPREPIAKKVLFDLYRILLNLKDYGICEYTHEELHALLPQGTELRGASQIMPLGAVGKTTDFLNRGLSGDGGVAVFFSIRALNNLPANYFGPENITRRHLGQQEVYFIQLDKNGGVEACTVVAGFAIQPLSLTATFIAGHAPSEAEFRHIIGSHFSRVCGLLSVVTLSAMIRLPLPTGDNADVHLHEVFFDLIGELGFRRSLMLPNELGEHRGLVTYDKTLF